MRQIRPEFRTRFAKHLDYIECYFARIFVENSAVSRLKFFSDPLVQFLWTKFRLSGAKIFSAVLEQIKASYVKKLKSKAEVGVDESGMMSKEEKPEEQSNGSQVVEYFLADVGVVQVETNF